MKATSKSLLALTMLAIVAWAQDPSYTYKSRFQSAGLN